VSDYGGRYVYWGVREHAMAAAMNGMALHGGVIPYGGTFLVFTDYCRPSIRLAALMGLRVVFVMTHDSIGLGEDGPTHQPVEHLAALRAIPNLAVFRPGDAVETLECWQLALERREGPSVLALTRQNLPALRIDPAQADNLCARGGYVLSEASGGDRQVTLIGTGSETSIALAAQKLLAEQGVRAGVVSLPCWELFEMQTASYRRAVLGGPRIGKVAVEAALGFGWERHTAPKGAFVGMTGFGASAPAPDLYNHFGITVEAVAAAAAKLA
jgi:transketolase